PVAPNYPGEVVERWRYSDGSGEIGVIASVTRPFCGGCTRARLSADGKLFTCLFATESFTAHRRALEIARAEFVVKECDDLDVVEAFLTDDGRQS
ncbi:MAG: hypothetical protein ACRDPC_29570, partial [Solirubrobacteraceae bacterium]